MRLIDANELMEHVWRDRLDTRERIAELIKKQPVLELKEVLKKIGELREENQDLKAQNKVLREVISSLRSLPISFRKEKRIDGSGCTDCEFETKKDYEMPCVDCKRNSRDYWRKAE